MSINKEIQEHTSIPLLVVNQVMGCYSQNCLNLGVVMVTHSVRSWVLNIFFMQTINNRPGAIGPVCAALTGPGFWLGFSLFTETILFHKTLHLTSQFWFVLTEILFWKCTRFHLRQYRFQNVSLRMPPDNWFNSNRTNHEQLLLRLQTSYLCNSLFQGEITFAVFTAVLNMSSISRAS